MVRELTPQELAWRCPEDWVPWKTSEDVAPATTIVGQDRAVDAIAFGLGAGGVGYNVFVTGLSGTGRLTTIKRFLDQLAEADSTPDDVCFVYNFRTPEEPNAVFLKAGAGRRFVDAMERMVQELSDNLPKILADKDFRQRIERAVSDLQGQEKKLIEEFEQEVEDGGFELVQIQAGPVTRPEVFPVIDEKPVPLEELPKLVDAGAIEDEEGVRLTEEHTRLTERLQEVFQGVADLRRRAAQRVEDVRRKLLEPTFADVVGQVRSAVGDERVESYLDDLKDDLKERLDLFVGDGGPGEGDRFHRWRVNLAVDNADLKGRPVILETEPTYSNVFGTVERSMTSSGDVQTSFMRIQAGSLLCANGGYLVLNAADMLLESRVWTGLKRALKFRRVQVQSFESMVLGAALLKPEAVPLDAKIVVIGDRNIYDMLYRFDSDFKKVFKVLADFDTVMPLTKAHANDILSVLRKVGVEEDLPPMDQSGMATMLEEAVRMGRWHRRFSSRFSDLADLLRESGFYARQEGSDHVTGDHIRKACTAYERRHSLTEDRSHDVISDGLVRVETEGRVVGQVNGLAVYDLGHHRFGKPVRITARVGIGREGIINVERQAGLSGPTYDKGVNILTGFLRGTFARRVPLTIGCSITFEQSYGGIDGDSASSTEIYAIVSALADAPIRQDIAVTGSVDQYGRVQAIGGVNEKVEGFFRVCQNQGLTGNQGVMVPAANVLDLHLSEEVIKAVHEGTFHVWEVESVEQGIELLTGEAAGEWDDDSGWGEGSVYGRCQDRLEEMVRLIRKAGKPESNTNDNERDRAEDGDKDHEEGGE